MPGNKIQKILIVVFLVSTVVLAVIVTILYAQGNIYQNGQIVTTGTLKIQTDPADVKYNVYFNDKQQSITENQVKNIVEGNYIVKITADGYIDWTKTIPITKGIVSEIDVKLYPSTTSATQVTVTNIDKAFFSKDGSYIYYVVKNSEIGSDEGIWRLPINPSGLFFNQQSQNPVKLSDITPDISSFINAGTYLISESNDNSKILLKNTADKQYFVLNAGGFNNDPLTSIDKLINYPADDIVWFNGNNDVLVSTANVLSDYNLNSGIMTMLKYQPNNPIIFTSNNASVYIYDSTLKILQSYQGQKMVNMNLKNLVLPNNIVSMQLPSANSDVIYFGTSDGNYYYIDIKQLFVKQIENSGGKAISLKELSNDGSSAIFSDTDSIGYVFNAVENIGLNTIETTFTKVTDMQYQSGFIQFSPQSNQIIYFDNTAKSIKAVEPDGTNTVTLLKAPGILPFANLNYKADYLYMVMTEGTTTPKNNIYKVQLDKAN